MLRFINQRFWQGVINVIFCGVHDDGKVTVSVTVAQ